MKILNIVRKVPKGKVISYAAVARLACTSPRVVGMVMRSNRSPAIPCHRVVRNNGTLGGFNRGVAQKMKLLKLEGIDIKGGRICQKHFIA